MAQYAGDLDDRPHPLEIHRTKQIEDLQGETFVSEGVEANYMDMVNYAIFCLIKLTLPAA